MPEQENGSRLPDYVPSDDDVLSPYPETIDYEMSDYELRVHGFIQLGLEQKRREEASRGKYSVCQQSPRNPIYIPDTD